MESDGKILGKGNTKRPNSRCNVIASSWETASSNAYENCRPIVAFSCAMPLALTRWSRCAIRESCRVVGIATR